MTRGILNNNPGNIRWGEPWQGLIAPELRTDQSFCQFIAPEWGIRAIAKILQSYHAQGLMTLTAAITRWAPSSENDTSAYVADVARRSGLDPTACIDLSSYAIGHALIPAIIFHENGQQPYPDALIVKALTLAGVTP